MRTTYTMSSFGSGLLLLFVAVSFALIHAEDLKNGSVTTPSTTSSTNSSSPPSSTPETKSLHKNKECEDLLAENGRILRPVLLVGGDKFPLTIPEIDAHCDLGKKIFKGFSLYKRCLKGLPRQALVILNRGIRKYMRSICNSKQRKEDTIAILKCASESTLHGWTGCLETINRQLDWVAENSTNTNVIGNLCCVYNEATQCVKTRTASLAGCDSKVDTGKFLSSSMESVLKEVLEFLCGKYQRQDDCAVHNPEGLKALIEIAKKQQGNIEGPILIGPIIKAVDKLSGDDEESGE